MIGRRALDKMYRAATSLRARFALNAVNDGISGGRRLTNPTSISIRPPLTSAFARGLQTTSHTTHSHVAVGSRRTLWPSVGSRSSVPISHVRGTMYNMTRSVHSRSSRAQLMAETLKYLRTTAADTIKPLRPDMILNPDMLIASRKILPGVSLLRKVDADPTDLSPLPKQAQSHIHSMQKLLREVEANGTNVSNLSDKELVNTWTELVRHMDSALKCQEKAEVDKLGEDWGHVHDHMRKGNLYHPEYALDELTSEFMCRQLPTATIHVLLHRTLLVDVDALSKEETADLMYGICHFVHQYGDFGSDGGWLYQALMHKLFQRFCSDWQPRRQPLSQKKKKKRKKKEK
eukprot:GFYU01020295.1.p1 GENE.GFYU01020295.1~~GFYU01020295.1.p1  ORF type:complete len:346 (-),score=41.21 GFYU01020295.1:5-1042(-)